MTFRDYSKDGNRFVFGSQGITFNYDTWVKLSQNFKYIQQDVERLYK